MKTLTLIVTSALIVGSLATAAFAGGTDRFANVDGNRDQVISMAEAMGAFPTLTGNLFDKADGNHNGILDEQEFQSLRGLSAAF